MKFEPTTYMYGTDFNDLDHFVVTINQYIKSNNVNDHTVSNNEDLTTVTLRLVVLAYGG